MIKVRNSMILLGDVRASLRTLPEKSVHCCVTSPPYWGLRAYGTEPQVWGGRADCEHAFDDESVAREIGKGNWSQATNGRGEIQGEVSEFREPIRSTSVRGMCRLCGAWRGELGSEPIPTMFIDHLVEVFREVRRVLRPDGICWCNIGDSYASARRGSKMPAETLAGGISGEGDDDAKRGRGDGYIPSRDAKRIGVKHKDMMLIPWRLAIALQDDGWWVRDVVVWHKPAPMPESVTDRCTKSWEPVFMLAKSERYFADMESVKEIGAGRELFGNWCNGKVSLNEDRKDGNRQCMDVPESGRNLRNVWTITTEPLSMPHFAAYPTALPARCIQISTSEKGVCPKCGAQWVRSTNRQTITRKRPNEFTKYRSVNGQPNQTKAGVSVTTTGWQPSCTCNCEPIPATVLDPFLGSGSTSVAAERLGRHSIGCELNEKYAREIAVVRIKSALVTDSEFKQAKPLNGQKVLL